MPVLFDTITTRNEDLRSNPKYGPTLDTIDSPSITADVVSRFRSGITTRELDAETAAICIGRASHHSDYEWLAARIYVSDLHKRTPASMLGMVRAMIAAAPSRANVRMSDEMIAIIGRASTAIDARMDFTRDYRLRFFGYQTIARSYLLRPSTRSNLSPILDDQLMERPQHLYMRVALGIFVCLPNKQGHLGASEEFNARLQDAFTFYDTISMQHISNASPTMLNAGTVVPQLSSCFQLSTGDDLASLFDTVKSAGLISKWSGGISLWLHNIRADGAPIRSTGGRSSGIKRYVKILNEVQMYVNQGGNRPGAFAIYLGVDHADIFDFLKLARLKGPDTLGPISSPDLKYALWVSDMFMEALTNQIQNPNDPTAGDWYLFCPDSAPGLHTAYGDEYRALYNKYVSEGNYVKCVKAGDIIAEAFKTWAQVGIPYVLFKDAINNKSNMKNVAPICSSNLCCEITIPSWSEFDAPDFAKYHPDNGAGGEFGVCNLAAVCLENFVTYSPDGDPWIDYRGIIDAAATEARALNKLIDLNHYPSEECRRSNQRHRPIGVGIMGLADVLAIMKVVYGSAEAAAIARAISASVYYGALSESCRIAAIDAPYATFSGSPISKGKLQPDLWVDAGNLQIGWESDIADTTGGIIKSSDWSALRSSAMCGVRNAYVTAYMPTATTSNVVGQNECFEPFTSNIYTRKTLAGEFLVVNRHLMAELTELKLWDDNLRREIIADSGSVRDNTRIPQEIRRRYRTVREIHPSFLIKMAKSMSPFICQSMSMNLFLDEPNLPKIIRFLIEGWKAGLKTGMYYCHTAPAAGSQKTSVRVGGSADETEDSAELDVCRRDDPTCAACAL
jgi:ribonucleoside-diphosphate reductase alpha subunit